MFKKVEVLNKNKFKSMKFTDVKAVNVAKSIGIIPLGFSEVMDMSAYAPVIIMGNEEKIVFDVISTSKNGLTFDEISEISGKNSEELPTIILSLVLSEIIEEIGGNRYKIKE